MYRFVMPGEDILVVGLQFRSLADRRFGEGPSEDRVHVTQRSAPICKDAVWTNERPDDFSTRNRHDTGPVQMSISHGIPRRCYCVLR